MAYQIITSKCTNCGDCKWDCPTEAISVRAYVHWIDPTKCLECKGFYDKPQCASVCPVPNTCVPLKDGPN